MILPGLKIIQRWTPLRLQAKLCKRNILFILGEVSCFNQHNAVEWIWILFRLQTLHCGLRPTCKVNGKGRTLTPMTSKSFSNLNLTAMITSQRSTPVQIFISIRSSGAFLQICETLRFCDFFPGWLVGYTVFFPRARAQFEPVDGFLQFMAHTTWFYRRTVLLEVASNRNSFGGNIPQKHRKRGCE